MNAPDNPSPTDPARQVRHLAASHRFEIGSGDATAILSYTPGNDHVAFDHTYVPDSLRGRGIAAVITRAALEEARLQGWKIVPSCSYVASYIQRHPEFSDVLYQP